jgi:hypothetical protein
MREEIARLEALEAIKSQSDIDLGLDDEIIDHKPDDIKVFDDIDFGLDDEILDGKPALPVDSNHLDQKGSFRRRLFHK